MYWISLYLLGGMILAVFYLLQLWAFFGCTLVYLLLGIYRFGGDNRKNHVLLAGISLLGFSVYMTYDDANETKINPTPIEQKVKGTVQLQWEKKSDGELHFYLNLDQIDGKAVNETLLCRVNVASSADKEFLKQLIPGSKVTLKGKFVQPVPATNPGEWDNRKFYYFKRIHWFFDVHSLGSSLVDLPKDYSPQKILFIWRMFLLEKIDQSFPQNLAPLMKGLLIGVRTDIDSETVDLYKQLGMIHVLAISGLHMAVLTGSILAVLRACGFVKETTLKMALVLIPIYILLTGAVPSVVRAGTMMMLVLVGRLTKRPIDNRNVWGTSLFIMLLWNPYQIWDIGFQLSFGCVWGLIAIRPLLGGRPYLSSAISAQLCSYPFTVYYFHHFFLLSLLANLLYVPIFSAVLIPVGFLSLGMGAVHPGLAYLLTELLNQLYVWTKEGMKVIGNFTWFDVKIGEPSAWWLVGYYFAIIHGLEITKEKKKIWIVMLILLMLVPSIPAFWESQKVTVTFLDVGQGDAIVIHSGNKTTLIDGGPVHLAYATKQDMPASKASFDEGKRVVIPFLQWAGIDHLDRIIATHGDLDHIGGLSSVIQQIPVSLFLRNGKEPSTQQEKDLLKLLEEQHIPIRTAYKGFNWKDQEEVEWTVLNPLKSDQSENDNNRSVVVLLRAYNYRILFTGDLEKEGEERILADTDLGQLAVLKVGHHGSKSSTSEEWADHFKPKISILSVGRNNRYGHPHKETLNTLAAIHSQIYRTDKQGAITIEIEPNQMKVRTFLQQAELESRQ